MYSTGINGARFSEKNQKLVVSSGISSLDELLGGGLVAGSITLLEEDAVGVYANIVLKYFLAEGVVCKHNCFIASLDEDPKDIIENLPSPVETDPDPEDQANITEKGKKKKKKKIHCKPKPVSEKLPRKKKYIHHFDLTKKMPHTLLKECVIHTWSIDNLKEYSTCSFNNPDYHSLLLSIKEKLEEEKYLPIGVKQPKNIFRIALRSLGSTKWWYTMDDFLWESDLIRFFNSLEAIIRGTNAVTFVVLDTFIQEPPQISRCMRRDGLALKLESFTLDHLESNPHLSDYNGFFHYISIPRINTLISLLPSNVEYVFQLREKKFVIKTLHRPPDLQKVKENNRKKKSLGCKCSDKHF